MTLKDSKAPSLQNQQAYVWEKWPLSTGVTYVGPGSGHILVPDAQAERRLISVHKRGLFVKYKYLVNEMAGSQKQPHHSPTDALTDFHI